MIGRTLPSWLIQLGPVLLRHFVKNKNDPYVNEVELLEAVKGSEKLKRFECAPIKSISKPVYKVPVQVRSKKWYNSSTDNTI